MGAEATVSTRYLYRLAIIAIVAVFLGASSINGAPGAPGRKASGASLYADNCAKCHGTDGRGLKSLNPPDFTDAKWQSANSDSALAGSIGVGKGVMPGYKNSLSAQQINALVRQVRSFAARK